MIKDTQWTKEEIERVKFDLLRAKEIYKNAYSGKFDVLKKKLRIQTSKLEKAVDTMKVSHIPSDPKGNLAAKLAEIVYLTIILIVDKNLPIEQDYLIWGLIAVRKHCILIGDAELEERIASTLTFLLKS